MSNNNNEIRILISDSKQNIVPLRVKTSDRVSKIYEMLKLKKVIRVDSTLTYNGIILEKDDLINNCEFEPDCIITCMASFPAGIFK